MHAVNIGTSFIMWSIGT